MEEKSRINSRRTNIRNIILRSVQVAGLLSIAVVAPNVVGAMHKLGLMPSLRQNEISKRSYKRLVAGGYLVFKDGFLRLTPKGTGHLLMLETRESNRSFRRKWDRKWRILIFDIPEYRRPLREKMRRTLMAIGFKRLQDSVWIYPYDCEDLITLLKADFRIGRDVLYMIVDQLEGDQWLRKDFGLRS